jgi:hypothetical protein
MRDRQGQPARKIKGRPARMMLPAGASTAPTEQTSEDATHSDTYRANWRPSVDDTSARRKDWTKPWGRVKAPHFLSERPVLAMNF